MKHFLGIDPGVNGGLVVLDSMGNITQKTCMASPTQLRVWAEWVSMNDINVFIEDIHSMYGMSASSMWTLAKHCGALETLFIHAKFVQPKVWQKALWIDSKFDRKTLGAKYTKARSKETAASIWPTEKWLANERCRTPHDGMIDAALIALYGVKLIM